MPGREIAIRRSARARRIRVTVTHEGRVVLVAPVRASDDAIARAIDEARPWIARTTERLGRIPALGLDRPGVAWRAGAPLRVVRDIGASRAAAEGGVLVLRAPDDAAALRALDRWYRATCRELIRACLPEAAELLGVEAGRVTVREAKTRWGSCSAGGDLNFNWRLALAPEPVLRHVVVHELAHLVHRDHSRRFWAVVERADPATPARRAFLRRHGAELLAYDPGRALLPACETR
jgi:predicted metal-dependent hydrolase